MTMSYEDLEEQLSRIRPKLHRYCARMTGSVIDGEDVVQDTLVKATSVLSRGSDIANLESWLFRIAHNAAIDFLRRRSRADAGRSDEDPDMLSDHEKSVDDPEIVNASLRTFMRLPAPQRAAVILMDVLGYPLQEIRKIVDASLPAVKSALHRGRMRLRELAREPEDRPLPTLSEGERDLLSTYINRFNARDFDAVRDMLAEEVKLDLVSRERRDGKRQVSRYFENYAAMSDWDLALGLVDGRPAIVVSSPGDPSRTPLYFVLLEWARGRVLTIRDFRYARYAMSGADIMLLTQHPEENGIL
ncbi:MAG: sigma-70 family RNA polymerase sigma factor [Vulcanimicrobiaceae bacterium]